MGRDIEWPGAIFRLPLFPSSCEWNRNRLLPWHHALVSLHPRPLPSLYPGEHECGHHPHVPTVRMVCHVSRLRAVVFLLGLRSLTRASWMALPRSHWQVHSPLRHAFFRDPLIQCRAVGSGAAWLTHQGSVHGASSGREASCEAPQNEPFLGRLPFPANGELLRYDRIVRRGQSCPQSPVARPPLLTLLLPPPPSFLPCPLPATPLLPGACSVPVCLSGRWPRLPSRWLLPLLPRYSSRASW